MKTKVENNNEFKLGFIGCFNRSVILTYLGTLLILLGTYCLMLNMTYISVICLIVSGICDLFDGVVARKCKRNDTQKSFGIQIDSLADIVNFVLFPALFVVYISNDKMLILSLITAGIYLICGITRLAWFNITTSIKTSREHYQGLPVTYISLILPIWYVITRLLNITGSVCQVSLIIIVLIVSILFILDIPIKKPRGIWYGVFPLTAIALTVVTFLLH